MNEIIDVSKLYSFNLSVNSCNDDNKKNKNEKHKTTRSSGSKSQGMESVSDTLKSSRCYKVACSK
jgi:hypothetical protein